MRSLRVVFPPARRWGTCALPASILLLIAASSFAAATVRMTGTVRDAESGAAIANALVSLSALHRSVLTGEDGRYSIDALPGTQRVVVSRMGFAGQEFDAIIPESGDLEINIAMRCEPIRFPAIRVRAALPLRGLAPSTGLADKSVSRDELNHDPVHIEPDFLRAMSGGDVVIDPENPSGLHVRGGASDQVGYMVDGIPVFNPYHSAGTFSAWNPDAISHVDLLASAATPAAPDALSGTVSARTRTPGAEHHTRGSVSATQARATFDGPLGDSRAGYLLGITSAFPGLAFHKSEASHVDGDNVDLLSKIEAPLLGGALRVVGFGSRNDVDTAALGEASDTASVIPPRNAFAWKSGSAGAEWSRDIGSSSLTLRSWLAAGDVNASWPGSDSLASVHSTRREAGSVATLATPMAGGRTTFGLRFQHIASAYDYRSLLGVPYTLDVSTPVSTAFVEHARNVRTDVAAGLSLSSSFALGHAYLSPNAQLRWTPRSSLAFTISGGRRHQFGQSLRNAESVTSNVFPADLYVVAGANGVPVAVSNVVTLGAEQRPRPWLRLAVTAYARDFSGLALVSPGNPDPFATHGFTAGDGRAYGVALQSAASSARFGVLASYGYQDVRLEYTGGGYVPGYGAVHSLEGGVTFAPSAGYSVRLGYEGMLGRRGATALGDLEYEAVNMLDQGGEFGGSPLSGRPGAALPAYHRIDLGVRKSWHTRLGHRDGVLAAFGTVSNLLSRENVLTFEVNPATGARTPIEMRPFSPLVVGIDWQF